MKNKIEDLRDHLFETLEALRDPERPMALDRARAICDVSQTIINSAKVEVDFINAVGKASGSGFIPEKPRGPAPLEAPPMRTIGQAKP
jgi:hypothetical protein